MSELVDPGAAAVAKTIPPLIAFVKCRIPARRVAKWDRKVAKSLAMVTAASSRGCLPGDLTTLNLTQAEYEAAKEKWGNLVRAEGLGNIFGGIRNFRERYQTAEEIKVAGQQVERVGMTTSQTISSRHIHCMYESHPQIPGKICKQCFPNAG
ncbi:hypothetical protein C8R47DRAFT_1100868 [Mycena vitilis]|nr:hypothetical protein C8R47DRAFT_1100868 [Mycena vitilis]